MLYFACLDTVGMIEIVVRAGRRTYIVPADQTSFAKKKVIPTVSEIFIPSLPKKKQYIIRCVRVFF